jgi:ferredoxin-NADP reductase
VPVVLIAGGIGITPMMSMLRWCLWPNSRQRPVHLYYGVRNRPRACLQVDAGRTGRFTPVLRLNVVYSRPQPGDVPGRDFQHAGHVDVELLRRTLPHGRHQFYVCGPPAMMQSLVPALRDWGVQAGRHPLRGLRPGHRAPATPTSNEPQPDAVHSARGAVQRSGRTLAWDGQDANLLDFAERHGLAVESGCRSGSCGACETRLLSGVGAPTPSRPDHDIAKGHCLLCVGKPQSALVLEA